VDVKLKAAMGRFEVLMIGGLALIFFGDDQVRAL
jgi:hypothetical protein